MSIYYKCKYTWTSDPMEPAPIYIVKARKPWTAAAMFLEMTEAPRLGKGYIQLLEGYIYSDWAPIADAEPITINAEPFLQTLYSGYRNYSNDFFTGPDGTNPPYQFTVYVRGLLHGEEVTRLETITANTPNEAANKVIKQLEKTGLKSFYEVEPILSNKAQAGRDNRPNRIWREIYESINPGARS